MFVPFFLRCRELKTDKIGQLASVCGTVTRTSEVRPELIRATFLCEDCGTSIRNVQQQFKYTLVLFCFFLFFLFTQNFLHLQLIFFLSQLDVQTEIATTLLNFN